MIIEFRPPFEKSMKRLPPLEKDCVYELCHELVNVLENRREDYKGLGLKRLRNKIWEIRKDIKLRIIFEWEKDYLKFLLVGDHNQIKNYLKKN